MVMLQYRSQSVLSIKARETARSVYWDEYDRDEHTCWCCGSDAPLEVHHRDGDPLNNHLLNLVAVCHSCHRAIHRLQDTAESLAEWKASVGDIAL